MLGSPTSKSLGAAGLGGNYGGSGESELGSSSSVESADRDNKFVDHLVSKLWEDDQSYGLGGGGGTAWGSGLDDVTRELGERLSLSNPSSSAFARGPASVAWSRAITGGHSDTLRSHLRPVAAIPGFLGPVDPNPIDTAASPQSEPPPCVVPDPMDLPLLPPPEYLKNMPPPASHLLPAPFLPEMQETSGVGGVGCDRSRPDKPLSGKPILSRCWVTPFPPKKASHPPANPRQTLPVWMHVPPPPSAAGSSKIGHQVRPPQPLVRPPPPPPAFPNMTLDLQWRLEECFGQLKQLEKERKKAESELAESFPSRKINSSVGSSLNLPRLPHNPTKVDRLIVDQFKEHSRVVTLCGRMDRLRGGRPLNARVGKTCDSWIDAIRKVQLKRREEIVSQTGECMLNLNSLGKDDREVVALAEAIGSLTFATQKMRTALWCALQSTMLYDKSN